MAYADQSPSPFPVPSSPLVLTWHLFVEPRGRSGSENMAVDQALLDRVAALQDGTACLRLYRWNPPCLSFGRHEPALARYDRAAIERLGLDVVRRPTGGRAVWHQHEVTYAVVAPIAVFGSLRSSYLAIHRRLARALRSLGVRAALATGREPAPGHAAGPCFRAPGGGRGADRRPQGRGVGAGSAGRSIPPARFHPARWMPGHGEAGEPLPGRRGRGNVTRDRARPGRYVPRSDRCYSPALAAHGGRMGPRASSPLPAPRGPVCRSGLDLASLTRTSIFPATC